MGRNCRGHKRTFMLLAVWMGLVLATAMGEDSSVGSVHSDISGMSENAELRMLFRGSTPDECQTWQGAFRAKLLDLLGGVSPPDAWQAQEEGRQEFDDHVRIAFLLQSESIPAVPAYLLVPKGADSEHPAPAVLCIHGHGPFGNEPIVGNADDEAVKENIAKHNYDYGLAFVRRGYVVAAPCMIPFGRRVKLERYGKQDPCAVTFVRMQALGKLPIAENVRDLRWCIDFLQSRPEVIPDRIGCAGLSYGGRMTMMVSAVDERIKVAAVSGALNLLQERITHAYSCGSQIIPGLLEHGDFSEIGSLIAPRPCVWEIGSEDGLIVPKWDDVFRERLERAYRALDAEDDLHFDEFEGGHRWNGEVAFPLFDSILRDNPGEDKR